MKLSAERFRSEFLDLRHDIRSALGDGAALEDIEAAVQASQKENELLRLKRKLNGLRIGGR